MKKIKRISFGNTVIGNRSVVTLINPPKDVADYIREKVEVPKDLEIGFIEATDIGGKAGMLDIAMKKEN